MPDHIFDDEDLRSHHNIYIGRDEQTISRAGSVYNAKSITSLARTTIGELPLIIDENAPQFTIKALLAGTLAGTLCTFLALYYGLKVGVTPSMNILGATVGYGVVKALMRLPWVSSIFTPQENAVIQTISVALYSIACPAFGFANGWLGLSKEAYEVLGGEEMEGNYSSDTVDLTWWRSFVWCLALFPFGFFIAYPLKNYYIVKKRLFFPSGTATSYIIQSLHEKKSGAEDSISYLLKFFSLAFCVNMIGWCFSGVNELPIFGMRAAEFGWVFDFDLGSFGIGMLLSVMTNASMLLGAFIIYGVLQPWIVANRDGDFPGAWYDEATLPSTYLGRYAYALFAGLAIMIVQGVWGIGILIYTVIRGWMADRKKRVHRTDTEATSPLTAKRDEIFTASDFPVWVPYLGYIIFGVSCALIMHFMLGTEWYQTLVALIIVPVFACSNIEGMGRTDWDIASSYGKLVMFPIGAWNRGKSIIPSVAICHTTISGCSNSAMLMQDFKTGYLLGANPSIMFYSQFLGALIGCIVTPSLFLLLRTAYTIPTSDEHAFISGVYAPVYRSLAVVATGNGFESLPKNCLWICLVFLCLAVVLNLLHLILPERVAKYLPDPSAMSIGMLVGATVPLEFFIGGLVCAWWAWWDRETCERNKAYIASGTIAGSGVAVVIQCLMSLASLNAPVVVSYAAGYTGQASVGAKVVGVIVIIICVLVLGCGLWFWFPSARLRSGDEGARLLQDDEDDDMIEEANDMTRERQSFNSSVNHSVQGKE